MTEVNANFTPLTDEQVTELEKRIDSFPLSPIQARALCATVKHLRERVQLLDSRWCECGHTKDKHGFFSDHDECSECDQSSPDLCCEWRPVARPDTQLEHLQSQLEQLRAERDALRDSASVVAFQAHQIDGKIAESLIAQGETALRSRVLELCKSKAAECEREAENADMRLRSSERDVIENEARAIKELATELEKL